MVIFFQFSCNKARLQPLHVSDLPVVSRPRRIYMQWANLTTWRGFRKPDGPLSTTDEHTNHISASQKSRIYLLRLYLELAETSVSQKKGAHTPLLTFCPPLWPNFSDSEIFHCCYWTFPQVSPSLQESVSLKCRTQFSDCLSAALCWFHSNAPHFEMAFLRLFIKLFKNIYFTCTT